MLLHCPSKKCNTTTEHQLKVDTNEVMCLNCEKANESITQFMKATLRSNGHLYKANTPVLTTEVSLDAEEAAQKLAPATTRPKIKTKK